MTDYKIPQKPGDAPRALPIGAPLPKGNRAWLALVNLFRPAGRRLADRVIGAGFALPRGTVNLVTVRHDDWCATLRTDSMLDCCCDPTVEAPRRVA